MEMLWTIATIIILWGCCMVYVLPVQHRSHFGRRMGASFFLVMAVTLLLEMILNNGGWMGLIAIGYYLLFFSVTLFCGRMNWQAGIYCIVWEGMTYKLGDGLWMIAEHYLIGPMQLPDIAAAGIYMGIYLLGFALLSLTIARWMPKDGSYQVGPRQLVSTVLLAVIFECLYDVMRSGTQQGNLLVFFIVQLYCATVLYLQSTLFRKSKVTKDLERMDWLWRQQQMQYSLAKENIALLNQKCHDLKYQVAAIREMQNSKEQEPYLQEMEETVRIYESMVHTGNEVLDVILTEKSLYCQANHIQVHCIVDGSCLTFMDPVDVYTIFGNALDNAIESVAKIEMEEKRSIDVLVHVKQQFAVINIQNPCEHGLVYKDGLPVSTKVRNGHHGFGVRSIQYTVAKYKGKTTLEEENGMVSLRIVIPLEK